MRGVVPRLLAVVALVCAPLAAARAQGSSDKHPIDHDLFGVVQAVEHSQLNLAMQRVNALIAAYPTFRLGYLIRGDLLLARTHPLQTLGDVSKNVPRDKIDGLRSEALARLNAVRDRPNPDLVPQYVLQLAPQQRYAIVVDSSTSRLYLYRNHDGLPRYVDDYYVTLGKRGVDKNRAGDQRTPIGIYHFTASLPGAKLADMYGAGAFPLNYPNAWDRSLGRSGFGIWLHGSPSDTYSRPPHASDGCVVLSNHDFDLVAPHLRVDSTPIVIADRIRWTAPSRLEAERRSLLAALDAWRDDWESRNLKRYLSHYSRRFHGERRDFEQWAAHKRLVDAGKTWIKVGMSDVSMIRYPSENFVVVTFVQDYRSNNLTNTMRKKQYWVRHDDAWKIVYEGPTDGAPPHSKEQRETIRSLEAARDAGRTDHGRRRLGS